MQQRVVWSAYKMEDIWPEKESMCHNRRMDEAVAQRTLGVAGVASVDEDAGRDSKHNILMYNDIEHSISIDFYIYIYIFQVF
jgi:hypothetical protein